MKTLVNSIIMPIKGLVWPLGDLDDPFFGAAPVVDAGYGSGFAWVVLPDSFPDSGPVALLLNLRDVTESNNTFIRYDTNLRCSAVGDVPFSPGISGRCAMFPYQHAQGLVYAGGGADLCDTFFVRAVLAAAPILD